MNNNNVIVVGAGIAGLTSAAILSKLGFSVTILEGHSQSGGCAGSFKRKNYTFDVGATQTAGFERNGIHSKIFSFLDIPAPKATILDPACIVDLNDGSKPINIWYEEEKWALERELQFPGSSTFWKVCSLIHQSNWDFANSNPILPANNLWDFSQLLKAIRLPNILSGILIKSTMFDLLKLCGCHQDKRLIKFLNLQLKLYSQEDIFNTAALYGCTVLNIAQKPHGLWHLENSMQDLSDSLELALQKKANILFNEKVEKMTYEVEGNYWKVCSTKGSKKFEYQANYIVYTAPPQSLLNHLDNNSERYSSYLNKIKKLPKPSGAVVLYAALKAHEHKIYSSNHYQIDDEEVGSLFISLSNEGDGRAPKGEITLNASFFTNPDQWFSLDKKNYKLEKIKYIKKICKIIENKFSYSEKDWLHRELSTPLSFQKWTSRPKGIVGGLGQSPGIFGLFGLPSRTPFKGLYLCGDSLYPGEGTAGVSQSALIVVRQILASKGLLDFEL